MLKAIIDKLKTGSITNVFPRGQNIVNSNQPYIVVWQDLPILQNETECGVNEFVINTHFPMGHIEDLIEYTENELYTLLNKQRLTTADNRHIIVKVTGKLGAIEFENDDNTASRERVIVSPAIYGGV